MRSIQSKAEEKPNSSIIELYRETRVKGQDNVVANFNDGSFSEVMSTKYRLSGCSGVPKPGRWGQVAQGGTLKGASVRKVAAKMGKFMVNH